jgi:hypothetical protein
MLAKILTPLLCLALLWSCCVGVSKAQQKGLMPVKINLPITIKAKTEVEVTHHEGGGSESRGKLYVDFKIRPFRLRKGQRFQMVEIGQEGGCRIRVNEREYDLSSCPWLPGFTDPQSDIYEIVKE